MSSIFLAISGYFLISLESIFSKFLLSGKMKSWRLYVFYVGLLSLFSLVFAFFGIHWYGLRLFSLAILSGVALFFYLVLLYQVLQELPASLVYVTSGAISTIGLIVISHTFSIDKISLRILLGILLLITGGLTIIIDPKDIRVTRGTGKIIMAGILLAVHLSLLKYVFLKGNFISGYVYSRMGEALATGLALLIPSFRLDVIQSFKEKNKKENTLNFGITTVAKTLSGMGNFLVNAAIFAGSVTVVNALMSVQYLFTFLMSVILTVYFKKIFGENLTRNNFILKTAGVILVAVGVVMVA